MHSVSVEDEGKCEDAQSAVSGGEEYEPISDDELDEILADSQKRDDQQDEEKIPGTNTKTSCSLQPLLYSNNTFSEY